MPDRKTILTLAAAIDADPRTVTRWLLGKRVLPAIARALERERVRLHITAGPQLGELPRVRG